MPTVSTDNATEVIDGVVIALPPSIPLTILLKALMAVTAIVSPPPWPRKKQVTRALAQALQPVTMLVMIAASGKIIEAT